MPNWCDNQITITGPNSVIDKIEKIVKEESNNAENGLLQFFHPMPKELLDTEAGPTAKTKAEKYKKITAKKVGTPLDVLCSVSSCIFKLVCAHCLI